MNPFYYIRVFQRRWHVIAASVGVALLAAFITTAIRPTVKQVFEATAELLARFVQKDDVIFLSTIAESTDVAEIAAAELGFEGDPRSLADRVTVRTQEGGGRVAIAAKADEPEQAEKIASAFADALLEYLDAEGLLAGEATGPTDEERVLARLRKITEDIKELEREMARKITAAESQFELTRLSLLLESRRAPLTLTRQTLLAELSVIKPGELATPSTGSESTGGSAPTPIDVRLVEKPEATSTDEIG
ncbi:MAG: hypothetical protein ACRD1T_03200, partial [Acidimicrobiia bacterium]